MGLHQAGASGFLGQSGIVLVRGVIWLFVVWVLLLVRELVVMIVKLTVTDQLLLFFVVFSAESLMALHHRGR